MFKVLISEDELLVRLGIKASTDWKKFDMTVIADVGNGQEAWEIYEREKPDIILTDIKMPVMDGITLIEKIREKDTRTRIIILTCLEEFDLARKAVSLGVSDYILKLTMSRNDLEEVLKKVRNELKESQTGSAIPEAQTNTLLTYENVLYDYLFYGTYSTERLAELLKDLKITLSQNNLILCLMEIDHYQLLQKRLKDEQGKLIRFSILNIINEITGSYKNGITIQEKDKRYVIIFSFPDIDSHSKIMESCFEILEHIRRAMRTYLDISVTFAAGSIRSGFGFLREMYRECAEKLEYKYFYGLGKNIISTDLSIEDVRKKLENKLKQLIEGLDLHDGGCVEGLGAEFNDLLDAICTSRADMQKLFLKLGHGSFLLFRLNREELTARVHEYTQLIGDCESLDEAFDVYSRCLREIAGLSLKKKSYSKEVATIIRYIQEHYNMEITLNQLAEMVELSPNYLCSLFKKELNMSLVEYLTQFRIEKAKELLLNTNLKSYEISEKVGFSDESYFSRTFKKITGVRPNEFKRQTL